MSSEIWRSEVVLYSGIFFNLAGVLAALLYAWWRGWLSGLNDASTNLRSEVVLPENDNERS